ncbi:hypothetical protein AB6813_13060 [bacterium RCC_150]
MAKFPRHRVYAFARPALLIPVGSLFGAFGWMLWIAGPSNASDLLPTVPEIPSVAVPSVTVPSVTVPSVTVTSGPLPLSVPATVLPQVTVLPPDPVPTLGTVPVLGALPTLGTVPAVIDKAVGVLPYVPQLPPAPGLPDLPGVLTPPVGGLPDVPVPLPLPLPLPVVPGVPALSAPAAHAIAGTHAVAPPSNIIAAMPPAGTIAPTGLKGPAGAGRSFGFIPNVPAPESPILLATTGSTQGDGRDPANKETLPVAPAEQGSTLEPQGGSVHGAADMPEQRALAPPANSAHIPENLQKPPVQPAFDPGSSPD